MPIVAGIARASEMDRLAVEDERALARRVEAGENLHQRRLAGAIVADDAQDLAGIDVEIHIAQRGDGAEIFVDAAGLETRDLRPWLRRCRALAGFGHAPPGRTFESIFIIPRARRNLPSPYPLPEDGERG